MYNVRYTDHESNIASSCIMSDTLGLVICVSDIIHDDAMLDSWSVYLTLYMMTQCWTRDLCIWHYTKWCWTRDLCIWHYTWMTPCWTLDLCIWHYTEWLHIGLVICIWHHIEWRHVGFAICVSDIIHDDAMLDSWSVYLTFYRMTPCWTRDLCIWHYTEWCWTRDLCIWHYTEWRHVGLVIVYLTLYRMTPCWTNDLFI